jgi:hypothetical protein
MAQSADVIRYAPSAQELSEKLWGVIMAHYPLDAPVDYETALQAVEMVRETLRSAGGYRAASLPST